jgi:hypothetical protein
VRAEGERELDEEREGWGVGNTVREKAREMERDMEERG